jgi:STE24 endopeptidase
VKNYVENPIAVSMLFIGILAIVGSIIDFPFSYYDTFVIEEKFGFNKTTKKTYWLDKIKGIFLSIVIGGGLLWAILWFYHKTEDRFWWYAWILVTVFTLFMTLFYSNVIVPLFNKQKPLKEGELKNAINEFAKKTGFTLDNIFVIDGSKRSTKANAYFTGFGPKKRVVLYDTLINDLSTEEIVAVLAHEIGHFQKKHVFYNMILSILLTGFTLFVLSIFIGNPVLSQALGVSQPSFHIGIIAFGILYNPFSEITGLIMNQLSRKFEYQADAFAKDNYSGSMLVSALKKLSKNSLSNLTPHPWYVFWHYSHPTLLQRINQLNLKKTK